MTLPFTPADLGFEEPADGVWQLALAGRPFTFRRLDSRSELLAVEALQRDVFGVDDRDLAAASALVVVPETGGFVLGAFPTDRTDNLAGFLVAWGGYVRGRPRLVSDMLGVRPALRGRGLGAALKRLQAALALRDGFEEIVWTVDPLRAANARLNFGKFGAYADRYEVDRYGPGYGAGFYGGLPTDRLHVTWGLTDPRVRDRLLGQTPALTRADVAGLPEYAPGTGVDRGTVRFPAYVDALLARDEEAVRAWRFRLREILPAAFAGGYAITGFVANVDREYALAAYVLTRQLILHEPTTERNRAR